MTELSDKKTAPSITKPLGGAAELGATDLLEDSLDLPGGVAEPARLPGGQEQLLLLELEQQELEEVPLLPQHVGQAAQGHRRVLSFRSCGTGAPARSPYRQVSTACDESWSGDSGADWTTVQI